MTSDCPGMRVSLGAYVLGALDPAERSALEAHLASCPACRDELADLAGLPGLLGRLAPEEAAAGMPRPGPAVLDRSLAELRRRRRLDRRRRRLLAAFAAALFAVVGAGIALAIDTTSPPPAATATGPTLTATDPATGVHAAVTAATRPWGTALGLHLQGVQPGQHCQLVAVGRDGRTEVAGSWQATYTGQADITGATAIALGDLASLRVVTTDRILLVAVPVSLPSSPDTN